jgi:hypothetical protein
MDDLSAESAADLSSASLTSLGTRDRAGARSLTG